MYGLIIKKKWLDLIISGKKTLEIRGSRTSHLNETIYLLESGSGRVKGTAKIGGVYPISSDRDWEKFRNDPTWSHCVDMDYQTLKKRYPNPYAWCLGEVTPISEELFYEHPKGAVIWVSEVKPHRAVKTGGEI